MVSVVGQWLNIGIFLRSLLEVARIKRKCWTVYAVILGHTEAHEQTGMIFGNISKVLRLETI
jgi:hypothetical protein